MLLKILYRKTANDPLFIEGLKGLERPREFKFPVDYTNNNYDVRRYVPKYERSTLSELRS